MTEFILLGLVPFAVLGILLGHLLNVDSIGPSIGGITALFSFLGGVWFPITNGVLHDLAQALPSYWLVQARTSAIGGSGWGTRGWIIDGALDARCCAVARGARVPPRHRPGLTTIARMMAEERELSLQEQLEEIGTQLDWVRGYL